MSNTHLITREIGIDTGHRVTYHGSKCKNLHGHRYRILATCKGPLYTAGEQEGMVLDFGFLKEEMMREIDEPCDHGTVLWGKDPLMNVVAPNIAELAARKAEEHGYYPVLDDRSLIGKLYVVPFVPTAENLAKHWFERLESRVAVRTDGQAELVIVKVWETPNCSAVYHRGARNG